MTTQADEKVVEQLAKWNYKGHQIPKYIELYRRLLELKIEDSYLPTLNKHLSKIANSFTQGEVILQFEDLLPHWQPLEKLFQQASSVVAEYSPSNGPEFEKLTSPQFPLHRMARAWYQYSLPYNTDEEMGIDSEALSLCFQAGFHPLLVKYSEALSPLVNQESWRQRLCPVCGGKPDIAFLSKETGARWLVCSRCDTEWLFLRLECPFCGNRNQDSLAYSTNESQLYRLYICEQCRCYIKAIDLRRSEGEVLFPLERILTLDLDRQAHEAGYEPGWVAITSSSEH